MNCKGVLIVEDDLPIREAISILLKDEGIEVQCTTNGKEALEYLENCAEDDFPGLILLDIMMPVMDGFKFLEIYNDSERYKRAPVVVMSANSSFTETAVRDYTVGQLKKPVSMDDLINIVRRACTVGPHDHMKKNSEFSGSASL